MNFKVNETEVEILMQDRCTREEAVKLLKKGTIVYKNPEDYIQSLKDNDCWNGETVEEYLNGEHDYWVAPVEYKGHTYLIAYAY